MENWIQIKASCNTADLELVAAVMSMYDNTLMIEDPTDIDHLETIYGELIDESLENADRTKGSVSLYRAEEEFSSEFVSMLQAHLDAAVEGVKLDCIGIKEEDWKEVWKQYYKPLAIGQTLTVVPVWEKDTYAAKEGEKVLLMDPGVAFGSGTHETTRLCALLTERHLKPGMKVLDVGTGSGILAIAAALLGAGHIDAYDLDPVAVRIAKENCAQNGVTGRIDCGVSDLLKDVTDTGYDLITANIVADIILRMAPDVTRYLAKDGVLIVSGIIDRQAMQVREALEGRGLVLIDQATEHDWNSMAFVRG